MTESTKIEFRHRRVRELHDMTDIVEILFPGNRNQQRAAACTLHELKWAQRIVPNLRYVEGQHRISRRTLQRTRAKLARLGLIEHVSSLNARYGGQQGWRLSGRLSAALRLLADAADEWRQDTTPELREKEQRLIGMTW